MAPSPCSAAESACLSQPPPHPPTPAAASLFAGALSSWSRSPRPACRTPSPSGLLASRPCEHTARADGGHLSSNEKKEDSPPRSRALGVLAAHHQAHVALEGIDYALASSEFSDALLQVAMNGKLPKLRNQQESDRRVAQLECAEHAKDHEWCRVVGDQRLHGDDEDSDDGQIENGQENCARTNTSRPSASKPAA